MTDIHSHTLWRLDDGSPDFETTLRMCRIAADSGTDVLFLTPHIVYWNKSEQLFDRRESKFEELSAALEAEEIDLKIVKGFEILCDDEIFNIKYFKPYTLAGSRYILIEFDFYKTDEEDVSVWCDYLKSHSLVPIIAHPERYEFVINDITSIDRLSRDGVLFQINAGSPLGFFGDREAVTALRMLKAGYVDFLGSDAHSDRSRNTDMMSLIEEYPDFVTAEYIERITCTNPDKILNDEPIEVERFGNIAAY